MLAVRLALVLALAGAAPVTAQSRALAGTYRSLPGRGDHEAGTLTLTSAGRATYRVALDIGSRGCTGSVAGRSVFETPYRARLEVPPAAGSDQTCTLEITVIDARTVFVSEHEWCGFYHGASCGFQGVYRRAAGR